MRFSAVLIVLTLGLAACGESGEPATQPSTTPARPATTLPATTLATPTTSAPPEAGDEVVAANDAGMTVVVRDESAEGEGWSLDVARPRLVGHPDAAVTERVASEIATVYDATIDAFWRDLAEIEAGNELFRYDVSITPEVTLFDDEVLSLRLFLFWSSSTAAHPTDDIETVLVDLATGDPYTLPELLSGDSAPEALLSLIDRHILDDILGGDEDFFNSVVEGRAEPAFGEWALTPESFDVSYGRYEAGPGVLGSFTVSIPYEELGVLINPDGPIAGLAAA